MAKDKHTIFTIGYEGATMDNFVTALLAAHVKRVVDVRAVPLSRKKGFSKNKLAEALAEYGIEYTHFRDLGTPREGRTAVKNGDIAGMHRIFGEQLERPEAQSALTKVAELAAQENICLLCFEADPDTCHRTLVATALQENAPYEVKPLYVGG